MKWEMYDAEKMREKIQSAVSTWLRKGGLFVESGTSLATVDKLLTPGFWDYRLPVPPPHPPPPHTEWCNFRIHGAGVSTHVSVRRETLRAPD